MVRMMDGTATMQNGIEVTQKSKIELPYDTAIPISWYLSKRNEIKISKSYMYSHVH